jgi:hypothetical protein
MNQGMEKDFKFAEHVCEELLQQSTQKEQKDFLLKSLEQLRQKVNKFRKNIEDLWCLTPPSTIFQLYRGDQFYWSTLEKNINLSQLTDKLHHPDLTL